MICDVGGQDIKIIILKNGRVKDFKLNTQCSAGNGYFLQSTAQGFNFKVEEYADVAFAAKGFPSFGYGCAVFMQSDIVDFQRQGWKPEEIMAGLGNVLPKNIWLYVSQIPNLSALGTDSSCRAARSTTWPPSKRRSISSNRASRARSITPKSSCTSIAAKPAPSAPRSKPDASGITAASAPSSAWTRAPAYQLQDHARTKPRAATSARTSACAPSSTSRPTMLPARL